MVTNRRGWLRVLESFISITLVVLILLALLNRAHVSEDVSGGIYSFQNSLLTEIRINESMRLAVLNVPDGDLPLGQNDPRFPAEIGRRMRAGVRGDLDCSLTICGVLDDCTAGPDFQDAGSVYVRQAVVTVNFNSTTYNPRKLKLFCTEK